MSLRIIRNTILHIIMKITGTYLFIFVFTLNNDQKPNTFVNIRRSVDFFRTSVKNPRLGPGR